MNNTVFLCMPITLPYYDSTWYVCMGLATEKQVNHLAVES